jgi:3-oxoacyl-[acyl-carrier protein] reductase
MKPLALVTGASRGIGAAIALRLAKDGFYVCLNYSSNESKAREVLDQITASGGTGELCGFDVSQSDQVDEKIEGLKAKGPLRVLVNRNHY